MRKKNEIWQSCCIAQRKGQCAGHCMFNLDFSSEKKKGLILKFELMPDKGEIQFFILQMWECEKKSEKEIYFEFWVLKRSEAVMWG